MKQAQIDYANQERNQFVLSHYGQVVATMAQIMWCSATEDHLNDQATNPFALAECYKINIQTLNQTTGLIKEELTDL